MKLLRVILFGWIAGTNLVAQPATHSFGLLRTSDEAYNNHPVAGVPPTGLLPSKASLEEYLPPPGNQGERQGSCTAWASTFALRTALQAKYFPGWQPLSDPKRQFSPSFVFNQFKTKPATSDCTKGIHFEEALDLLRDRGAITLDGFGYDPARCDVQPSPGQIQKAKQFRIANYSRTADQSRDRVKIHLAAGDPVLAAVNVYDNFDRAQGTETIKGKTLPLRGYHALILIGYDDEKQAFRIQNSWGHEWGDAGRAWLDYATFESISDRAYVVVPKVPAPALELPSVSSVSRPSRRFGIVNNTARPEFTERLKELFTDVHETIASAGGSNLAVRVNAFDQKDAALSLARRIVEGPTGLNAKVVPQPMQGKTVYAVLVGAELSPFEAELVIKRAKRAGFNWAAAITLK